MRDMTEANRAEFESFMAERFTDSIDRRRCINGDGNDYMSWDMGVARTVWQHMQQKLDAVLAENVALKDGVSEITYMDDESFFGSTVKAQAVMGRLVNTKTPATDALLNAVRAEGAVQVAQALEKIPKREMHISGQRHHYIQRSEAILTADDIAAQLRAETDTTSSRYESLAKGGV